MRPHIRHTITSICSGRPLWWLFMAFCGQANCARKPPTLLTLPQHCWALMWSPLQPRLGCASKHLRQTPSARDAQSLLGYSHVNLPAESGPELYGATQEPTLLPSIHVRGRVVPDQATLHRLPQRASRGCRF